MSDKPTKLTPLGWVVVSAVTLSLAAWVVSKVCWSIWQMWK